MTPLLENASAADFPAIASLNVESYREFIEYITPESWALMSGNISKPERIAERATFIVAKVDGVLAGSVAYCPAGKSVDPIPAEWSSILLLAVSPQFRGRGIGELLAAECLRRARAENAAVIGLFTSERMLSAQRIYEKLGFMRESEIPMRLGMRYYRYWLALN